MNGIGQAVQAVEHHITETIRSEASKANQRVTDTKARQEAPTNTPQERMPEQVAKS